MSGNAVPVVGIRAGDIAIGTPFKRSRLDSQGYTIWRIEPEEGDLVCEGHIMGYNAYANRKVYDIRLEEIVYPITDENRTSW